MYSYLLIVGMFMVTELGQATVYDDSMALEGTQVVAMATMDDSSSESALPIESPVAEGPPSHSMVCCLYYGLCELYADDCPEGTDKVLCPCPSPAVASAVE